MNRKKEIKEELEQIAPFLAKIEKRQNFKVPDNYFEQLSEQVHAKIAQENKTKMVDIAAAPTNRPRSLRFKFGVVAAAASIVLAVGSFFYFQSAATESDDRTLAATQYFDYVEENIEEFEEEMMLELSQDDELDIDFLTDTDVGEQSLDNYLEEFLDDDIDDSTLEELL